MTGRIPAVDGRFRQRVYEIVRLVPYGQVTTYCPTRVHVGVFAAGASARFY